ncbi:hypothetical protein GA707_19700 [Nostocoides sp. F2B08]|uniref:hypothetical protein n=1 Tax=Nostocoides sp. F2B08 TaxID=2653936 RepID=UPI001262CE03|nr:hypothetical protein [Tetrasphaera sp. F2B08]KAB7740045.1 hypothetical protein GA707_19700 [Tetrasphaera sp. F2B08]
MSPLATRPVALEELQRAWRAVQAGQFRAPHRRTGRHQRLSFSSAVSTWSPAEPVLPVIGCVGQCGASTLALALATAAGDARVVECCSATCSGLTTAATAELGHTPTGWRLGRRDRVEILRAGGVHLSLAEVPLPDHPTGAEPSVTVLDVGWDLGQVLATPGWVEQQVATAETVLLVTSATVPGLRRLDVAATILGPHRCLVALVGAARRWSPPSWTLSSPTLRALQSTDRLIPVATEKHLARDGLSSAPLPPRLLKAAATILTRCHGSASPEKGTPS